MIKEENDLLEARKKVNQELAADAHKKMTFQIQGKPFGPVFDYAASEDSTIKKSQVLALYLRALEISPTDIIQVETFLHNDTPTVHPLQSHRVFRKDVEDDEEIFWREVSNRETISLQSGARLVFAVSSKTPPPSPVGSDDEEETTCLAPHKALSAIRDYLLEKPGVWNVLLFGSFLVTPKEARDIDIGIECRSPQDPSTLVMWKENLATATGYKIDIVDLSSTFQDNMRSIRKSGKHIGPHGIVYEDDKLVNDIDVMGSCLFALVNLRDQLRRLDSGTQFKGTEEVFSYGVAKMFEAFYQQWENFSTRLLKAYSIPVPQGPSSHIQFVNAFRPSSKEEVYPTMNEETINAIDDLRRFRHFSRKVYVEYYDLDILYQKLPHLPLILTWVNRSLLEFGRRKM